MLLLASVSITIATAAPPALDQRYPKSKLIDGLVEHGMTDLLQHLVETEPPADPAEARELIYRIHLSRWEDLSLNLQRRQKELALAAQSIRALIKDAYEHESRPIWQTDLAGILLFHQLDLANIAGAFYEFGVVNDEQRRAVEDAAPEALVELNDAMLRLFVLQGDLPKQADHVSKRVNTGRWDRLMTQYYNVRTPYYLGQACLYAALLPVEHALYADLEKRNPKLPLRAKTEAEERARLTRIGIEALEPFIEDDSDPKGVYAGSLSLTARLLLVAGDADGALGVLDRLREAAAPAPVTDLLLRLARARALQLKGDPDQAAAQLRDLDAHETVQEDTVARLLVVDAKHRLLLARAQTIEEDADRDQAIENAYGVYDDLFNDKRVSQQAQVLKMYVYKRWAQNIGPDQDLSALPAMMLRAAGQMSMDEAEALHGQAPNALADEGGALHEQALAHGERALRIYDALLRRPNLSDAARAEALYNQALALHRTDESDAKIKRQCINQWAQLAEAMPDQRVSELAIANAVELIRPLMAVNPDDRELESLYEQVTAVLFDTYGRTHVADHHRVYYAQGVLIPAERFEEAIELLQHVRAGPQNQVFYFTALQERLYCLQQLHRRADEEARRELSTQLRKLAEQLKKEALSEFERGLDAQRAPVVARVLANAHLFLAAMLLDEGQADEAIAQLEAVEGLDVPRPVKNAARGQLIGGLAKLGQLERARQEAERLMQTAPDDAAPVIYDVLDQTGRQIEQWRNAAHMPGTPQNQRRQLLDKAHTSAGSATKLAAMLVKWARRQNVDETQLAGFELIEAKANTVAGLHGEALKILKRIEAMPPFSGDLGLLDAMGDAYFQQAAQSAAPDGTLDEQARLSMIESARYYDTILQGVAPDERGVFPPQWWNAWMRRLQINDRLDEDTQEIPLRVRQLKLTDPQLGGEPYKTELMRLGNKHQLRGGT